MFETKDGDKTRSWGIRVFDQIPWMARAYMYLLLIFLLALFLMGLVDAFSGRAIFAVAIDKMLNFLGLIVGSVIGALSAALKQNASAKAQPEPATSH